MKQISSQQQVWKELRTEEQRATLAKLFRHIKHRTQYDLCLGILAFLRWDIIRNFEDPWINSYYQRIITYLQTEQKLGRI